MNTRERVAAVLKSVTSIPTLPLVATQLLKQADNESVSLSEIAQLVERDPAVTTRLLKLVNSPFFGMKREVASVQQALLFVGLGNLRSLVLSSSVLNMFNNGGRVGSFDRSAFWDHCLVVAMCARQIATNTKSMDPDVAFTAGLIHDIGKLIEDRFLHSDFEAIVRQCDKTGCTMAEAERDCLQVTHADIGQFVARYWKLPELLQSAIGFHHAPEDAETNSEAAAIICLADEITRAARIGSGGGADHKPNEAAMDLAKLSQAVADRLRNDIAQAFEKEKSSSES